MQSNETTQAQITNSIKNYKELHQVNQQQHHQQQVFFSNLMKEQLKLQEHQQNQQSRSHQIYSLNDQLSGWPSNVANPVTTNANFAHLLQQPNQQIFNSISNGYCTRSPPQMWTIPVPLRQHTKIQQQQQQQQKFCLTNPSITHFVTTSSPLLIATPPSSQTPSSASVSSADSLSPTINSSLSPKIIKNQSYERKLSPISDQSDETNNRNQNKIIKKMRKSCLLNSSQNSIFNRKFIDNNKEDSENNLSHLLVFAHGTPIIVSNGKTIPVQELDETHFRTYEQDFYQHMVNNCMFSNISNNTNIKQKSTATIISTNTKLISNDTTPNTCSFKTLISKSMSTINTDVKLTLCSIIKFEINDKTQTGSIEFLVNDLKTNITMKNIPIEMPLFERKKRWTSMSPDKTFEMCNLKCKLLEFGDECMMLLDNGTLINNDSIKLTSSDSLQQQHLNRQKQNEIHKLKRKEKRKLEEIVSTNLLTTNLSTKSSKKHRPEKLIIDTNSEELKDEEEKYPKKLSIANDKTAKSSLLRKKSSYDDDLSEESIDQNGTQLKIIENEITVSYEQSKNDA